MGGPDNFGSATPHCLISSWAFWVSAVHRGNARPGVRPTDNLLGHTPSCSSLCSPWILVFRGPSHDHHAPHKQDKSANPNAPALPPFSPTRPPRPLFPSGPAIGPSRGCRPKQRVNTPPAPRPPQLNGNPSLCIREKKKLIFPYLSYRDSLEISKGHGGILDWNK